MPASLPNPFETRSGVDVTKLTRHQKLAILLVMLGPEGAAQVFKHLDAREVEAISVEMAKLSIISQELQRAILREFSGMAVQASTSVRGGIEFARVALEKALGMYQANDILGRLAPSRSPETVTPGLGEMEARELYNLIRPEQPQTVALILSSVGPEKAAEVLALIPAEGQAEVLERMATLAPAPTEVLERLMEVLNAKAGTHHVWARSQTGGTKVAADVLNAMEKNEGKNVLASIEERNPELGLAIRQKMFTFADLAELDTTVLQQVLREIDLRDLALALKNAGDRVKTALLSCISKRAGETVREEISFMGAVRLSDVENAQMRIIEVVRKLEAEGEIDLSETRHKDRYAMV